MLDKSTGILEYGEGNSGLKLILKIDPNIYFFYRSLIPKYVGLNPQKYEPHISVVRKEIPLNMNFWGKYEKEKVEFEYNSYIHHGEVYYWINAFSKRLEEIRLELGLSLLNKYGEAPEGFNKIFHITVGNIKKSQLD
jgi:hypothetical protein